jgi:hypothetical protein
MNAREQMEMDELMMRVQTLINAGKGHTVEWSDLVALVDRMDESGRQKFWDFVLSIVDEKTRKGLEGA